MKTLNRLLLSFSFLAIVNVAAAQAPKTLSYQGYLSDGGGPLTGSHDLVFSIYSVASGGTALWTETSTGVAPVNGNVSLTLGKINPINIGVNGPLWMGIAVDGNSEISPRVELSGSLYAIGLALPYQGVASGASDAFQIISLGTGSIGNFAIANASNAAPLLNLSHSGTGLAISANRPIQATQFIGDGSMLTGIPGSGLSLPYSATLSASTAALEIVNTGSSYAAQFAINNPASGAHAVYATSNGSGNAGSFYSSGPAGGGALVAQQGGLGFTAEFNAANSSNNYPVMRASTNGTGRGLQVDMFNSGSDAAAIYISHSGTGNAITANRPIEASKFIGDGSMLTGIVAPALQLPFFGNSDSNPGSFNIDNTGIGGAAANFSISNPESNGRVISATNLGSGPTLETIAMGEAVSAFFKSPNELNAFPAVVVEKHGNGSALELHSYSTSSGAPALSVSNWGTGNAIYAGGPIQATQFIGDGSLLTHLPSFSLPFQSTSSDGGDLFSITSNGSGTPGSFTVSNSSGGQTALIASTDGMGAAAIFSSSNTISGGDVVSVTSEAAGTAFSSTAFGAGRAGSFQIAEATNESNALFVTTVGLGPALTLSTPNPDNNSPAMHIHAEGNGGVANFESFKEDATFAAFRVSTAASNRAAGEFTNYGTGGSSGYAGYFSIDSNTSGSDAMRVQTSGTGTAATFHVQNGSNTSPVINITGQGSGNSITASGPIQALSFIGDGSQLTHLPPFSLPFQSTSNSASTLFNVTSNGDAAAGRFEVDNTAGTQSALVVTSNSAAPSAVFTNSREASGGAVAHFSITSSTNNAEVIRSETAGGNTAGLFLISNASNNNAALQAETYGNGSAMQATAYGVAPAVMAIGLGTGPAVMVDGGLQVKVLEVNSSTITQRAVVYKLTTGGPDFTFGFSANEGDLCYIHNASLYPAQIDYAFTIDPDETVQLLFIGNAWRKI